MEIMVHKVVLPAMGSKPEKTVLLREMEMGYMEQAAKLAAPRAGDNAMVLSIAMQAELLKLLIIEVDGKPLTAVQKENLKTVFTYQEHAMLAKAVNKITGIGDEGNFQIELVSSGSK